MTSLPISISEVSKSFGKAAVLTSIDLNVNKGEIFGLLGPSGAGKTTLVKLLAGIDTATSGTVKVLDVLMPNLKMLNKVGYMAQSDALYNELTAAENLDFFASIYGLRTGLKKARVIEVMKLVNLIDDVNKPINQFSGGMKRRLSLAISLLHDPEILILDEPTVGIDPILRQSIWNELKRLSLKGTTIIVTTHVMDEAEKCDRLAMLREGKIIATGSIEALKEISRSSTLEEAFLYFGGVTK